MRFLPLIIVAVLFVIVMFLPLILAKVLDPLNVWRIRSRCQELGVSDVEIQVWPNHYGVTFQKDGQKHYAKCIVKGRTIKWKGKSPDEF